MNELNVSTGETHTVPEQETETHTQANINGALNVGGELNIGGESEVSSYILYELSPERLAWIIRITVNQVAGEIHRSEIFGEIPSLFKKPTNVIESKSERQAP